MVARSAESDVDIDDHSLQMDLLEIEKVKMDISAIEVEYKQVLESVRQVDGDVRRMKKSNDGVISSIKLHVRLLVLFFQCIPTILWLDFEYLSAEIARSRIYWKGTKDTKRVLRTGWFDVSYSFL